MAKRYRKYPRYHSYYHYPKSKDTTGGIKAQSKRGAIGTTWWARRWIQVLEKYMFGPRLSRGRSYARRGQVLSIEIKKGLVTAKVQGSRKKPYTVKIQVKTLSMEEWKRLARHLTNQAIYAASLLAGRMPENIEEVFREADLTLFPEKHGELMTGCSCPDWSNPCKHVAAVYYLLGEEFDRNPFLIFKLRGIEREELVDFLGGKKTKTKAKKKKRAASKEKEKSQIKPEPLSSKPEDFWGHSSKKEDLGIETGIPPVSATLPKQLGNFPFWRGAERFFPWLEEIYQKASPAGLSIFLGERGPSGED